ncbi:glycoside hydrolase family 97 protein [Pedobacter sp. Leaf194]|uniref:glycoside hydrolase family 97 protein n=1 Tax=Pedobacter sp. Leaf194 TaxID=1736297 RepID=UPI0007031E86|nr:glycoside hydrolase family 97 protein [Pedobacter sp. Leaf194]KQS41803.1 glycoside hydrolase [Pedobacter sp. Leaf194]
MNRRFHYSLIIVLLLEAYFATLSSFAQQRALYLQSENRLNKISLSLTGEGKLFYKVTRRDKVIIESSPLGLVRNDFDFTSGLSISEISQVAKRKERYELKVGNQKTIDHELNSRSVTFKNKQGAFMILDLVAGNEGVAFRYRFSDQSNELKTIKDEITGFHIAANAKGWLQPYNKAGKYEPGYEDFYQQILPGDPIVNPRNPSVGWCMPALFHVNDRQNWVLIAESGTDGSYPGCHLKPDSKGGIYHIAFAQPDEKYTLPLPDKKYAYPEWTLPWTMPWRAIIIGDKAGDILLSTLITDLAPASKITDTSWIGPGKAGWSWWSHPDDHSVSIYNQFSDLSSAMGFKYTLFDAGWEKANSEGNIIEYAIARGIQPLVWGYSSEYYDPDKRKKRFRQLSQMGIKGVKIDFWCSDRQEVMGTLQSVFEDAAKEHLLINLHGTTVPRGWHRTWPNFITAEAILGTESYFYDSKFPDKSAEQNTVLPFTRNVAGPADYTPFALSIRKFRRLNTAVHELATAMTYTSGIIHFADSKEVFDSLPGEVRELLREVPATWDKTSYIIAEPGKSLVLSREKGNLHYIVGINGTNQGQQIKLNLKKWGKGFSKFRIISEGKDKLMGFKVQTFSTSSAWSYLMAPKGGFIIQFLR